MFDINSHIARAELREYVEWRLGVDLPDSSFFSTTEDGGIKVVTDCNIVDIDNEGNVTRSEYCSRDGGPQLDDSQCVDFMSVKQSYSFSPDKVKEAREAIKRDYACSQKEPDAESIASQKRALDVLNDVFFLAGGLLAVSSDFKGSKGSDDDFSVYRETNFGLIGYSSHRLDEDHVVESLVADQLFGGGMYLSIEKRSFDKEKPYDEMSMGGYGVYRGYDRVERSSFRYSLGIRLLSF